MIKTIRINTYFRIEFYLCSTSLQDINAIS